MRELTAREWILLALLGIILIISGYVLLFYTPMCTERNRCKSEAESYRSQIEAVGVRIQEKQQMERELEELFAAGTPLGIADYDNLKPVMEELNAILAGADHYSLSFGTVDTSQSIVRRRISMSFHTGDYESAKAVLGRLYHCAYRCLLDNVDMVLADGGGVSVNAEIVFFEYLGE